MLRPEVSIDLAPARLQPLPARAARGGALAGFSARELFAPYGWLLALAFYTLAMLDLQAFDPARPLRMSLARHGLVSGAGAFLLAGTGLLPRREVSERLLLGLCWCVCLIFLRPMTIKVVISHVDHPHVVPELHAWIRLAVLAAFAALPLWWSGWRRLSVAALAAAIGALLLARSDVLHASQLPRIDVLYLAQEASRALWRGENPYAFGHYSNLYADTQLDLGYSPGYNYFPALLFTNALSDKLLGDVRAAFPLCEVLCAMFVLRYARAFGWSWPAAFMLTLLWCSNSLSFQVMEKWNDSLPLAAVLGTLALLAERRWLAAGVAFGVAATSKQYAPLAALPLLLWLARVGPARSLTRFVSGAALSAGLICAPFLWSQPQALLSRTLLHFARTPFRVESLSLLNWARIVFGFGVDSAWIHYAPYAGLALGSAAACAIVLGCRRAELAADGGGDADGNGDRDGFETQLNRLLVALLFVWAGLFHFIKQSFLNYHYFYFSVGVLLLVSLVRRGQAAAAGDPPTAAGSVTAAVRATVPAVDSPMAVAQTRVPS